MFPKAEEARTISERARSKRKESIMSKFQRDARYRTRLAMFAGKNKVSYDVEGLEKHEVILLEEALQVFTNDGYSVTMLPDQYLNDETWDVEVIISWGKEK
jgi:hypothetical protein